MGFNLKSISNFHENMAVRCTEDRSTAGTKYFITFAIRFAKLYSEKN